MNNQFRNGFMTAVMMFAGIIAVGMAFNGAVPSVSEAFVIVSEYPPAASEPASAETPSAPMLADEFSPDSGLSTVVDIVRSSESSANDLPVNNSSEQANATPDIPASISVSERTNSPAPPESRVSTVQQQEAAPPTSEAPQSGYSSDEPSAPSEPELSGIININTATSRELQKLSGIGEVKAQAIIDYRSEHGGFASVDELINVKGIGEKTLEKIRSSITV